MKLITHNSLLKSRGGQSLVELMIGLSVGSILIGASALAIASMLNANVTTQKWKAATVFSQSLLDNTRAYGSINWQNLYSLSKTSSTQYFFNASGTTNIVLQGREGVLENDVTNGLVGEWKYDEATGTIAFDATGGGNNGTLLNSPTRTTSTCKIGNCLNLNSGNMGVSIPNNNAFNFGTSSFSAAMWGYYRDYTYPKSSFMMKKSAICYTAGNPGWDFGVIYYSGGIPVCFNDGTNGPAAANINFDAGYRPADVINKWTQLVVVVDRSANKLKFYVNGVKQSSEYDITGIGSVSNNSALTIGTMYGWQTDGMIDEARIYNRALSADEVKQLYNSNIFTRYFYIENTCRTNDASSSISGVAPCAGGSSDDPSTQKINSITLWATLTGTNQLLLSDFVTRWKNTIFQQNDWSGGANASGTITNPTNLFSSSSQINFSGKSIRIQGL